MSDNLNHTATGMTVEDYLYGCVGFGVPESAISTILFDRGVEQGSSVLSLDKKVKDLCKADLYMWCVTAPSVMGTVEDANGSWKHKEGGTELTATDKKHLRSMANSIYELYGEKTVNSKFRLFSFGISMCKNSKR